jgi:DNA polymerase III alpha subunit (gram-positive type)
MSFYRNLLIGTADEIVRKNGLIVDVETTGFKGEIISLCIGTAQGQIVFNEKIRPKCKVEKGAYMVHGISDKDLENEKEISHYLEKLEVVFYKKFVCAYNSGFDYGRMMHTLSVHEVEIKNMNHDWFCLMKAFAKIRKTKWKKLKEASAFCGVKIEEEKLHDAKYDVELATHVLRWIANQEMK